MRLSATDASFLYLESASGPMHIASILVLDGVVDFTDILQHFTDRIHLIPAYRRRLAHVPFNVAHPTWVDDPCFELTNHLLHHRLPEGATLQDGVDAAVKLNEPMLDRSRPLWEFIVLEGVPDKTLVLQKTHHALIDGASGVELMTIIYDLDAEGANVPPGKESWAPEEPPSASERFNQAMRENLQEFRDTNWLALLSNSKKQRDLMRRALRVTANFVARPAITAPFNAGLVGPERRLRWMKQSFGEIREIRRAMGGTINDVVLTVVSEAVAKYLDSHGETTSDQYLRIMCPVNVRTEDQQGALGNQVSGIFPMLPAWPMPVEQRLASVCAEMQRIKQNQEAQALTLLQESAPTVWPVAMLPTQLIGTALDPTAIAARVQIPPLPNIGVRPPNFGINFVCTNVPGVQVPQYLCGHKITDQIGVLVLTGNTGFSVTILSYNQMLFFGFISEPRLLPDVEKIVEGARQTFDDLLAHARERAERLSA